MYLLLLVVLHHLIQFGFHLHPILQAQTTQSYQTYKVQQLYYICGIYQE